MTAFIEESLRERLARGTTRAKTGEPVRLHVIGKGGLQSSIDLDGTASLLDAMETRR